MEHPLSNVLYLPCLQWDCSLHMKKRNLVSLRDPGPFQAWGSDLCGPLAFTVLIKVGPRIKHSCSYLSIDIIPREDVPIEVDSLSTRGDGSSKNYKILSEMLEDFDRQDVEELYRLVKERYSASRPEGFDLMLWGDLYTLFEPDEENEIWKNQHEYNLISWRLCDFCGIHILLMENGLAIHMLTEKKYPLSQEMLSKMLSKRLEVDHESSQAFELLRELPAKVNKARVIMSSATSAVTYTSVYTDSEPGRAFWGADDEEVSEGGIPRVIILGYDGLPIQPVAPPSPDYIPGPEDPQTPPVPQDEDEREPMFVQAHDPDYVPEPIYPEYIPLEDDHEFPAEEQPLPPIDSPTAESPGHITESDPEEDPEEYEDDETEDGPVDYPMDGGDDGDDDDGDSSRDDANDEDEDEEDEDEEDEEEEEHLAPADSTTVIPIDEPVFPPERTEHVIPPPSTDITLGARIVVRPQTSIFLPPEAEVERLLTMNTPSPSPPISLSPPSARECLARCMAQPAHSPPLPPSSGCPTQIQTLKIASTQALIDAVTAVLPSHSLPPLPPSLYILPLVDRRDDIPESEQPLRKRLYLSTIGSRYEIGESSTARPTRGQGIDYGFVSTVDAEERRQGIRDVRYGIRGTWVDPAEAVPEIAPMIVGEVNTRVTELAELHEHDTQDLYTLLEDAQDSRSRISQRVDMDSQQATHQELQTHRDYVYAHETYLQAHQTQLQLQSTLIQTQHQVHETRFQMQQAELAALQETDHRRQDQMAELLALREQQRRAREPGPEARIPDHQDASRDADSHI
ncbi:hypothetical protein Tco_0998733 [Tanacetum coccineum]